MTRLCVAALVALLPLGSPAGFAQETPGGRMRIVLLVDSSAAISQMLTQFRAGLNSFLDALPGEPEVTIVSTGGQLRIRIPATNDRLKLHAVASGFAADGGGNVLLDSILEADKRFLRNDAGRRSVFVILTTDAGETMSDQSLGPFNRFVKDFVRRGGRAHAIIVGGRNRGVTSEIVENFVDNTNGFRDTVVIANALPKLMETVAAYVAADQ